jgi:hypothetical protein
VLRKVYFDNARKLLARSLPLPIVRARRISQDFQPNGELDEPVWQTAKPVVMEYSSGDYSAQPEMATTVRVLWSDDSLYLGYECPFTKLTVFDPPAFDKERHGSERGGSLWDRDVVEAFIASDPTNLKRYTEYQVAPTNEKLDLILNLPERDFAWSSGFQSAVKVDENARRWTCEIRIPIQSLASTKPQAGTQWRLNFFRCDRTNDAFLAWNPALTGSFHTPEKFGVLEFVE